MSGVSFIIGLRWSTVPNKLSNNNPNKLSLSPSPFRLLSSKRSWSNFLHLHRPTASSSSSPAPPAPPRRSPVSHSTCDVPFPPRRSGEYRKGLIPARPLYQGVRGSVWDPETSRGRVGDLGGPEMVLALLCVAERRATRPNGEWGCSTCRHMLGPGCHPEEALYLPTFSHLLMVNKLLSLCVSVAASYAGARAPRSSVTRQGVVLTDFQSLLDCQ